MSKQLSHVRTQIRIDEGIYSLLKDYAEKNKLSLNEAMNSLIHDGVIEDLFNEDNQENKQHFIEITSKRLQTLSTKEVRQICSLVVHISQLKGY